MKSTGATAIQTSENGTQRFMPLQVIIECTAASAIVGAATISVGTNASSYNNLLAATALTGVTAANNMLGFNLPLVATSSVAANTAINVNVTLAATGTSQVARVDVLGYYV